MDECDAQPVWGNVVLRRAGEPRNSSQQTSTRSSHVLSSRSPATPQKLGMSRERLFTQPARAVAKPRVSGPRTVKGRALDVLQEQQFPGDERTTSHSSSAPTPRLDSPPRPDTRYDESQRRDPRASHNTRVLNSDAHQHKRVFLTEHHTERRSEHHQPEHTINGSKTKRSRSRSNCEGENEHGYGGGGGSPRRWTQRGSGSTSRTHHDECKEQPLEGRNDTSPSPQLIRLAIPLETGREPGLRHSNIIFEGSARSLTDEVRESMITADRNTTVTRCRTAQHAAPTTAISPVAPTTSAAPTTSVAAPTTSAPRYHDNSMEAATEMAEYLQQWEEFLDITKKAVAVWSQGRHARVSDAGDQMWWCWHGKTKRLRELSDATPREPTCLKMDTFHGLRLLLAEASTSRTRTRTSASAMPPSHTQDAPCLRAPPFTHTTINSAPEPEPEPDDLRMTRDLLLDLFQGLIAMFLDAHLRRRKIAECVTLIFAIVGPQAVDAFRHIAWKRSKRDQTVLLDGCGEFCISFECDLPHYVTCPSIPATLSDYLAQLYQGTTTTTTTTPADMADGKRTLLPRCSNIVGGRGGLTAADAADASGRRNVGNAEERDPRSNISMCKRDDDDDDGDDDNLCTKTAMISGGQQQQQQTRNPHAMEEEDEEVPSFAREPHQSTQRTEHKCNVERGEKIIATQDRLVLATKRGGNKDKLKKTEYTTGVYTSTLRTIGGELVGSKSFTSGRIGSHPATIGRSLHESLNRGDISGAQRAAELSPDDMSISSFPCSMKGKMSIMTSASAVSRISQCYLDSGFPGMDQFSRTHDEGDLSGDAFSHSFEEERVLLGIPNHDAMSNIDEEDSGDDACTMPRRRNGVSFARSDSGSPVHLLDLSAKKSGIADTVSRAEAQTHEELRELQCKKKDKNSNILCSSMPKATKKTTMQARSGSVTTLEDFLLSAPENDLYQQAPSRSPPRASCSSFGSNRSLGVPGFQSVFGGPPTTTTMRQNSNSKRIRPESELMWMTPIEGDLFESPVQPMADCSGGTAPFYDVRYRPGKRPCHVTSDSYWIGKDLSHAMDELDFYEDLRDLVVDPNTPKPWRDLATDWCCCCVGVLEVPVGVVVAVPVAEQQTSGVVVPPRFGSKDSIERSSSSLLSAGSTDVKQLLLLQNLRAGFGRLRMLDLKMGPVTAVGGWRGKSEFRAWRNHQLDRLTNSAVERYRLEGIDNPPSSLKTYFEENSLNKTFIASFSSPKKVKRMILQRMRAGEFLNLWLDCRGIFSCSKLNEQYAQTVLLHTTRQLRKMITTFAHLDAPQMWIGSSIALGFDVEPRPEECVQEDGQLREEDDISNNNVLVKTFDWGRSELNVPRKNSKLSAKQRRKREKYWKGYLDGVCRLLWECARLYVHRAASPGWRSLVFELATFHSMHSDVVVAAALLPVSVIKADERISCSSSPSEDGGIELYEPYTIDLTSDRVVEARLDVVFTSFSPVHISVHVKRLSIFRRKSTRCIVGCVAFSNPEDVKEYTAMVAGGKGAGSRSFQGRMCSQYTGLCDSELVSSASSNEFKSMEGAATVLQFRDEVFEFIADPTGKAEKNLVQALDVPNMKQESFSMPASWQVPRGCANTLEERFPPCVGDAMQDLACAEVFRDEMLLPFGRSEDNFNIVSYSSSLTLSPDAANL